MDAFSEQNPYAGASRNSPCPCGSGRRFKDCHGALKAADAVAPNFAVAAGSPMQTGALNAVLQQALAMQQSGDMAQAERLYAEALAIEPMHADALHMQGVVLLTLGRAQEAVALITQAQALAPNNSAMRHNLGLAQEALAATVRLPSAIAAIEAAALWTTGPNDPYIAPEDVGLIAYYLPQFHRIPENDRWWGEGFTEWTNVRRGQPNFDGHYQPQVPGELGYYDLLDPAIRARQAALASAHGITGFAYYHYWFRGKRLLEQPLNEVLRLKQPDFPFCVFWANESWSRRWDGGNDELLMGQLHDPADDRAFIEHLLPMFGDPRYIRVQGRPLLMIYRVELFPDALATVRLWAEICRAHGIAAPYLVKADTGQSGPPSAYGFDAAVEFPPHRLRPMNSLQARPEGLSGAHRGQVFDMRAVMAQLIPTAAAGHRHFQCVVPAWDNTARKQFDGTMFTGERPELFRAWVRDALYRAQRTHPPGERLVFVNAWNEWAEGAHLEPCVKFGRLWLTAARDARMIPPQFQPLDRLTDAFEEARLQQVADEPQSTDAIIARGGHCIRRARLAEALPLLRAAGVELGWKIDNTPTQMLQHINAIAASLPPPDLSAAFRAIDGRRAGVAMTRQSSATPLVSVLLPSYGHAPFVEAALNSIFTQTYRNIELIIIDDGSPDDSVAVIERTIKNSPFPVRFSQRPNRGAHATINEALSLARGQYVNVLNSDDLFAPQRIAEFVAAVHLTGAQWGYSLTDFINQDAAALDPSDPRVRRLIALQSAAMSTNRQSIVLAQQRANVSISTGNLFVETRFLVQLGGFAELRYVHDWDFCLRAVLVDEPVFIQKPLYRYRFHGKNTITEVSPAISAEAAQVIARYAASAASTQSPHNPLAWSNAVDGVLFRAAQLIDAFAPKPSPAQFSQLVDDLSIALASRP